jgi:tetratricopeptide (TPR) repeat protein
MMIFNKRLGTRLSVLATSILITSCSLTNSDEKREVKSETLGNLVTESITPHQEKSEILNIQLLTRQQRTNKLVKIYRSLLTLEPDRQVRAQIQHRMLQLDIEKYEKSETLENKEVLAQLVNNYKNLLSTYPNRPENEEIQYQLAKTYDLLGKAKASILTLESLLENYPNTKHYAELQFRRAELYYNLQQYPLAYQAYQAVLNADNNEYYRLNSLYMSGWSLFKLNRLPEADDNFIAVLNQIATANNTNTVLAPEGLVNLGFDHVSDSHKSLAMDTQRVLSISLSQQQQAKSLVALLNRQQSQLAITSSFDHVLFNNLADFLLEKGLEHDAILTYQAYLIYAPHSLWAAKFSLALIDLYQQKNQFSKIKTIKERFVDYYGLTSTFWQQANENEIGYVLPYLLEFSLAKSRRLYAHAQELEGDKERVDAFDETVLWLKKHLDVVHYSNNQKSNKNSEVADKANLATQEFFLYADANFEAQQYEKALSVYKMLAYSPLYLNQEEVLAKETNNAENLALDVLSFVHIRKESAYASIVTINELLTSFTVPSHKESPKETKKERVNDEIYQNLLADRHQLTDLFIEYYGDDRRATLIAVKAAEYAFEQNNIDEVIRYSDFVLNAYRVNTSSKEQINQILATQQANTEKPKLQKNQLPNLDNIALKQVAIVSQLKANIRYQFKLYSQAEQDYLLALNFVNEEAQKEALNELIASAIYEQAKSQKALATERSYESAIKHYLRLGKVVPNSKYRANAEFDAANLLLAGEHWLRAIGVLKEFKQQFSLHQYASTIPAKLAFCYENLGDWSQAAKQLLVMVANEKDVELKRESQYTAAEYYLKAGDLSNALVNFRTYAHQYPEPFTIAQEVRFKMSEFYRETKEPNKRYFWYRKLISYHQDKAKSSALNLDRSTYLASYAAFNLGQAHQQTFNQTKLKVPLNKSLKRKQAAMKEAIHYYQLVFQWQLAEFVPQANYSIGQIYRNLAADVMKSERPKELDALALEEYEFVLEEIAYPFEEKAIEIHQANAERAWNNIYDPWVKQSLAVLAELDPAKYNKYETVPEVFDAIF